MFYDFEYGPAWYDCPAGRINCDITLRRQFTIEKGKLLGMFDSAIAIRDEVLQKLLSQEGGERMKNIVTTIGREQNRVIREDKSPGAHYLRLCWQRQDLGGPPPGGLSHVQQGQGSQGGQYHDLFSQQRL